MAGSRSFDFSTIENPYNNFLERQGSDLAAGEASEAGGGGGAAVSSPTDIGENAISGQSFDDMWIKNWIKSVNYKPGSTGFKIDGITGKIECSDISLSGGTVSYGKTSFTDSTNAGYILSSAGVYVGAASNANYLKYDISGATFTLYGMSIDAPTLTNLQSGSEIAIQGWQQDMTFSATDYRIVAWASGTITLLDGTTYSITGANTGNMAALTYIYLDIGTSTTLLQVSTTASNAVGTGKILIAVAQNNSDTSSSATYQVFGGKGGNMLAVDNIAANSASVNEFVANTANIKDAVITNAKINDLAVSKLTAGTITSKAITLAVSAGTGDVKIQCGKTDFGDNTAGFILGIDDSDSDLVKFEIGEATKYLKYDPTNGLRVAGTITISNPGDIDGSTITNDSGWTDDTAANAAQADADTAQAAADAAQTDATSALGELDDIAADNKITPVEKLTIKPLWDAIVAEKTDIDTQADTYSVSKTAYGTAYDNLDTYLNTTLDNPNGVFDDMTATTDITRATWDGYWEAYYNAKIEILNAIASNVTPQLPSDENLVGYWSFDDGTGATARDGSGNGNTGTLVAMGEENWVAGVAGSCLDFDGANEYINAGNGTILSGTMTISAWILWNNLTDSQYVMINTDTDSKNLFYHSLDLNKLYFGWRMDNDGVDRRISLNHSGILTAGVWHHIVAVIDSVGGTHKIYVDGVEKYTTTKTYTVGTVETPTYFAYATTQKLNGKLDEVRIYSSVLTANEIKALYLNPSGVKSALGLAAAPGADVTQTIIDGGLITTGYITLSTAGNIKSGQTAFNTGQGFWLGDVGGSAKFSIGNPAGNYYTYEESTGALTINGSTITSPTITGIQSGSEIAIQGWQSTLSFSASDYRTVGWSAGNDETITLLDGTVYTITAGNTGSMAALTYIYLDIATSVTVLQTTTTAATAVGTGKILIGVAQNNTDTSSNATFQVFGGAGGNMLAVDNIAANSASVNEFVANTANIKDAVITNAKINDLAVSKLIAGTITSKAITLAITPTGGDTYIAAGKTDFGDTTAGFILGIDDSDSDLAKFEIGNATDYFKWDGTNVKLLCSSANAIHIQYGSDILLEHGGDIKFTSVTAPTACTATLVATDVGNVDAGTHYYRISYNNESGETKLSSASNLVTTDATHKQVDLTAIPVSTSGSVTARKIYRTKAGGSSYYLLTTIADNTTTIYTDNIADASLTGESVSTDKENNSFGKIKIDGIACASFGQVNTFLGQVSGAANVGGIENTAIGVYSLYKNISGNRNTVNGYGTMFENTTGISNTAIGYQALFSNTTADYNTAIGYFALTLNTTGYMNTAVGVDAGYRITTGYRNTFLGFDAGVSVSQKVDAVNSMALGNGAYTTADNQIVIGNYGAIDETLLNGNVKIAGTAARATTVGTKALHLFDGIAPAGTLANGISLYSTAGELRVMDSGGTATLLSSHSRKTGEWIHDSYNVISKKRLIVQAEKMAKFIDKKFGTNFVQELYN